MQIDEEIHLEEYSLTWVSQYEEEKRELLKVLGDYAFQIEHFGSTSIPGMVAKPIVDILIGVKSLSKDDERLLNLVQLGYESFGEISPGRQYFRKRGAKSFNLAFVKLGSDLWINNIVLRDYLRLNLDEAVQYCKVKQKAYSDGARTLLHYSDLKGPFISELLQRARLWAGY